MAVPTLSTLTPSSGVPTGGHLVEITGTNFRLPTAAPAGVFPVPERPPSVRVSFGGVQSSMVAVVSATRLLVSVPKRSMPLAADGQTTLGTEDVDVVVENIDDSGVLIPGETVTAADAYTYTRPGIAHNAPRRRVQRAADTLVDLLRSEVLANTVLDTSTDYDPDTGTARIETQSIPQLVLTGPTLTFNAFFTSRENYLVEGIVPGAQYRKRRHRVVDLSFEIIGVTRSTVEMNNLIELLELVVDRNVNVQFECEPGGGDFIPLELSWTTDPFYERPSADPGLRSDLRVFRGTVLLKGLPITDFAEVDRDGISEVGFEVDTVTLEAPEQIGENLPAVQGAPRRSPPDTGVPSPRHPPHGAPRRSPPDSGAHE